ncbi:MAG: hypothetical protein Q4Q62_05475 [Thermoplasmata archaeon]|nr:hypothetical protein [Thermoplasmata archaeon]
MADTKVCPKCAADGKAGIMELQMVRERSFGGESTSSYYVCTRCGYMQKA